MCSNIVRNVMFQKENAHYNDMICSLFRSIDDLYIHIQKKSTDQDNVAPYLQFKKNYIEVLKKDIAVTYDGQIVGNYVYQPAHMSKQQKFGKHEMFLSNFNISLDDENKHIPFLYWISKQHNTPKKNLVLQQWLENLEFIDLI